MAQDAEREKRIVIAPTSTSPIGSGDVLSVEAGRDEDVEWVWSHDRERGSSVTGYRIVPRKTERRFRA